MASTYETNPIRIEAADAAATVRVTRMLYITGIVWDQGASGADGNQAIVSDKSAVQKWSQTLRTGNLVPAAFAPTNPMPLDGLVVPTLGNGVLFIYFQESKNN